MERHSHFIALKTLSILGSVLVCVSGSVCARTCVRVFSIESGGFTSARHRIDRMREYFP